MRKIFIMCAVFALVAAFTVPAAAVEHKFGGYWRTRAYSNSDFSGHKGETITPTTTYAMDPKTGLPKATTEDVSDSQDLTQVDTRTRLYYTATLHENLKLVNKFEMDAVWGKNTSDSSYGDFGADAVVIEVKNTYADFNLGDFNFKVGTQGWKLANGFLWNDDGTGLAVTYKAGGFTLPLYWLKGYEGGEGKNANDGDVDFYGIAPKFKAGGFSIQPYLVYLTSDDYTTLEDKNHVNPWLSKKVKDLDIYYLGVDLEGKVGPVSLWATLISESGDMTQETTLTEYDVKAYLAAVGATVKFGSGDIHAQFFTATGDENTSDTDLEAFVVPSIQSYTWGEIMGYGEIDTDVTPNSCARDITNIVAYNIGLNFKPTKKLNVALDVWQASLAEKDANGEDDLGTEIDLRFTYEVLKNLNLDLIGAYLMTGDATYKKVNPTDPDQEDVTEIAAQLSLKF